MTDLSEEITKILAKKHKSFGLEKNKEIARMCLHAVKVSRVDIKNNLGESTVTSTNKLNYQYIEEK